MNNTQGLIRQLKQKILQATVNIGEGHIASAFSILDIIWVLYDQVLRYDSQNPKWDGRDRFILSKGHGSLALYAVLAEKGFFPPTELENFATYHSILGGHPDGRKVPGIEASTGSLGHGVPMAVGMAMGLKIRGKPERVIVLAGDGESNEGTIWESALLASHHRLSNLTLVIDHNHSTDRALIIDNLEDKFKAFGWQTTTIDGHNHFQIQQALGIPHPQQPALIIAQTIKGNGVKEMESNPAWHHRAPNADEMQAMLKELE